MIKFRSGILLTAIALTLVLPAVAQQARQSEIASAARIYGYNLAEGNWTISPASCAAMPGTVLLHYHRGYSDGAESNFTALVPRSFGHVQIVPVLYHGATPFVPAPENPRNFALFNSVIAPVSVLGSITNQRWLELASCYAEMTGGNDFLTAPRGTPAIAVQPKPTVSVTMRGKTASVIFAERDSYHTYRLWNLAFSRNGRITAAQTQEQSVYAPKIARSKAPEASSEPQPQSASAEAVPQPPTEVISRPAPLSTAQPQQQSSTETERASPATVAPGVAASPNPAQESQSAVAQPAQPGWKVVLNPPQPPSKFVPNAPPPPAKTIPSPK